ncbi:hypothetical protein AgCh_010453 [Apium graveolens]
MVQVVKSKCDEVATEDIYRNPGPLQFDGPGAHAKAVTLCVEDQDYLGRTFPCYPSLHTKVRLRSWATSIMVDSSENISHAMIPQFSGESYDFWSIKMRTLFKSMELWNLVEKGYSDRDNNAERLRENKKKDTKALFFIQQAMHETIFSRIASAAKAKEA